MRQPAGKYRTCGSIGHQATIHGELPKLKNCWQSVTLGQANNRCPVSDRERVRPGRAAEQRDDVASPHVGHIRGFPVKVLFTREALTQRPYCV
jgi:hypothetical protein